MILVSDHQSSIVSDPRETALDCISSLVWIPESIVLAFHVSMILPVRGKQVDPSFSQILSCRVTVICFVADHSFGSGSRSSGAFFGDSNVCHDFLKEFDLSRRGRRGMASQRNTLAIDHQHELRSLSPLGFPDGRAPFFAGMNMASTNVSSQSRIPSRSSSERNARHISVKTPVSCHSLSRRQQVLGLGYSSGRSLQRAPVFMIHRIPSKHRRSSARGRPPLGFSEGFGINGSIFSHCSSVNIGSRTLIGSPPTSVIREKYASYKPFFKVISKR